MSLVQGVVVIPAFNRPGSLNRLLQSLIRSAMPIATPLIISLDGGYASEVNKVARTFQATERFTNVHVKAKDANVGLRAHIIECASIVENYDFVILLEDDLYVASDFYQFAESAIGFYGCEQNISGISLYAPNLNELTGLPFSPINNGGLNYFMQVPSSWGQAWSRMHWKGFIEWYVRHKEYNLELFDELPSRVAMWPESSWKKFFYAYCVSEGKYFAYPYASRTTNFADAGGHHMKYGTNKLQVNLVESDDDLPKYDFRNISDHSIKYDGFMEVEAGYLGFDSDVCINLNGLKKASLLSKYKYHLISKSPLNSVKSYGLSLKPPELNVKYDITGDNIFLCRVDEHEHNGFSGDYIMHLSGFDPIRPALMLPLLKLTLQKLKHKIKQFLLKWF